MYFQRISSFRLAKKLGSCSSRRRQHSKLRKTLASIDSVPPEIMSVAEIEKFQTRLDAAAKQLKFNRRQVIYFHEINLFLMRFSIYCRRSKASFELWLNRRICTT